MVTYLFIYYCGLIPYLLGDISTTTIAIYRVIAAVVCIAAGYFLGGLNFAIIISRKKYGVDVRDFGSGNAGMTNMRRTFGKKAGHITLAGDAGKCFAACIIGYILIGCLGAYIAGFFCVLGHMFPIQYKFKGGKGVVCTAVFVLMTSAGDPILLFIPVVFLICFACFAIIVLGTKYISLGSIISILIYPLILSAFNETSLAIEISGTNNLIAYKVFTTAMSNIIAVMTAVFVVFMHRENIKRILNRQESKFDFHMSNKKALYQSTEDNESTQESKVEK